MNRYRSMWLFLLAVLLCSSQMVMAQQVLPGLMPQGDPVITTIPTNPFDDGGLTVTSHGIYYEEWDYFGPVYSKKLWTTKGDISAAWVKRTKGLSLILIVITSDEVAHQLELGLNGQITETTLPTVPSVGGSQPGVVVIGGDDLYLSTTKGMFVTRDNQSWISDTNGIGSLVGYALTLDSSQNVYIGTTSGIYRQALTELTWHHLTGSPNNVNYLLTTSQDAIYASGDILRVSRDRGTTWLPDTAGIGGKFVQQLAIDTAGDLYALTMTFYDGNHIWRQHAGAAWQSIDAGLGSLVGDRSNRPIHSIAVNGAVRLGSAYGEFVSTDRGSNWQAVTRGLPATNVYAYYQFPSGERVMTTSLGLFTRAPIDTAWTKRFPQNGYLSQIPIFVDNSQHLYALGASRTVGFNQIPADIFISSDKGVTWQADTTGLSQFSNATEFVDELGNEHLATYSQPHMHLYVKSRGGTWQGDSSGYAPNVGDAGGVFVSDHRGNLYLTVNNYTNGNRMLRRSINGGNWSEVSISALGGNAPSSLTVTRDGNLVAGGNNMSIGVYDGNAWSVLPNPTGLNNPSAYPQSVDSSNRLWVIYGTLDQNYYYTPYGVYWTSDLGQHWTKASDGSINFSSLVSFGDTTYGLNSGQGLYYFIPNSASVASSESSNVSISIAPNPSAGRVEISTEKAISAHAEIRDLLGNIRGTICDSRTATWNANNTSGAPLPNGIYFIRIEGRDNQGQPFQSVRLLSIQK